MFPVSMCQAQIRTLRSIVKTRTGKRADVPPALLYSARSASAAAPRGRTGSRGADALPRVPVGLASTARVPALAQVVDLTEDLKPSRLRKQIPAINFERWHQLGSCAGEELAREVAPSPSQEHRSRRDGGYPPPPHRSVRESLAGPGGEATVTAPRRFDR
jgi:hypothetical protein